jgi:hypothetical protein
MAALNAMAGPKPGATNVVRPDSSRVSGGNGSAPGAGNTETGAGSERPAESLVGDWPCSRLRSTGPRGRAIKIRIIADQPRSGYLGADPRKNGSAFSGGENSSKFGADARRARQSRRVNDRKKQDTG